MLHLTFEVTVHLMEAAWQVMPDGRRKLEPLPPLDHKNVAYQAFNKDLYQEHAEVAKLTPVEVSTNPC